MIGYLAPSGQFYKCESYEHMSYAQHLCKEIYSEEYLGGILAEDYLLSKGWIVFRARDVYNNRRGNITDEQIAFIDCHLTEIVTNNDKKDSLGEMLLWDKDIKEYN